MRWLCLAPLLILPAAAGGSPSSGSGRAAA
jgi:hypothetical protein